jgi:rhodanese-related sulfurtransferase
MSKEHSGKRTLLHSLPRTLWVLAISALLIVGCTSPSGTSSSQTADAATKITAETLAEKLEDKDFTLINVHIPYEGEIPQTDLHIPYNEIAEHQDQLPDTSAPIVIYCRSGSMSASAQETLQDLGYTNVTDVRGGMRAWEAAGYELIHQERSP